MKAVHFISVILFVCAVVLAFAGQSKAAVGLSGLSVLIELIGSAITGKSTNT